MKSDLTRRHAGNEQEKNVPEKNNVFLKIQMYVISLWLLFVLIIPITLKIPGREEWNGQSKWSNKGILICEENWLPIICIGMLAVGFGLFKHLEYRWKGSRNLPVKVTEIKNENYEYLTFLTTYIVPLVCVNLDELRYIIVLFVLLIIMGIIFVKSDFYLGNPTLALMNYKLFRIKYKLDGKEYEKLVVTKDKLQVNDYIESIPFDNNAWYVRRNK